MARYGRRDSDLVTYNVLVIASIRDTIMIKLGTIDALAKQRNDIAECHFVARRRLRQCCVGTKGIDVVDRARRAVEKDRRLVALVTHQRANIVECQLVVRESRRDRLGLTNRRLVRVRIRRAIVGKRTCLDTVADQGDDAIELQVVVNGHLGKSRLCIGKLGRLAHTVKRKR